MRYATWRKMQSRLQMLEGQRAIERERARVFDVLAVSSTLGSDHGGELGECCRDSIPGRDVDSKFVVTSP